MLVCEQFHTKLLKFQPIFGVTRQPFIQFYIINTGKHSKRYHLSGNFFTSSLSCNLPSLSPPHSNSTLPILTLLNDSITSSLSSSDHASLCSCAPCSSMLSISSLSPQMNSTLCMVIFGCWPAQAYRLLRVAGYSSGQYCRLASVRRGMRSDRPQSSISKSMAYYTTGVLGTGGGVASALNVFLSSSSSIHVPACGTSQPIALKSPCTSSLNLASAVLARSPMQSTLHPDTRTSTSMARTYPCTSCTAPICK